MAESMDLLATDLEAALGGQGDCGCGKAKADADLTLPGVMPPLATLSAELNAALEAETFPDAGPGDEFEEFDDLGDSPMTVEQLIDLVRCSPGLRITFSHRG